MAIIKKRPYMIKYIKPHVRNYEQLAHIAINLNPMVIKYIEPNTPHYNELIDIAEKHNKFGLLDEYGITKKVSTKTDVDGERKRDRLKEIQKKRYNNRKSIYYFLKNREDKKEKGVKSGVFRHHKQNIIKSIIAETIRQYCQENKSVITLNLDDGELMIRHKTDFNPKYYGWKTRFKNYINKMVSVYIYEFKRQMGIAEDVDIIVHIEHPFSTREHQSKQGKITYSATLPIIQYKPKVIDNVDEKIQNKITKYIEQFSCKDENI